MANIRIAVLASGGGSNFQSLIDYLKTSDLNAEIVLAISNNSASGALERARRENIKALHLSAKTLGGDDNLDEILTNTLIDEKIDLVLLAGYMKKIGAKMLNRFNNRILNIHPALLPKFGGAGMYGMNVHRAVIAEKAIESGATVHIINDKYDDGEIIIQESLEVAQDDTPESLAKRVLEIEHRIYPKALKIMVDKLNNQI